jgi:hypothetical protein
MDIAKEPFLFVTASYLTCVENHVANTIGELLEGLDQASDAAIFNHTFQTLSRHHFLTEGFSNDFAQWVLSAFQQSRLAERLASIDVRDYISIAALRNDLKSITAEFCEEHPKEAGQLALEPFYFLRTVGVTVPLTWEANSLPGFRAGLERLSHASFYHHFLASRLRLHLRTNDFSHWFSDALGLDELADKANRIDIYTNTLDSARAELIVMVEKEMAKKEARS